MKCYLVSDRFEVEQYYSVLAESESEAVQIVRDGRFLPSDESKCVYITCFNYPGGETKSIRSGKYPIDNANEVHLHRAAEDFLSIGELL